MPEHNLILGDIRVLDLSEDVAGPFCTKLLAGLGAEVIRSSHPAPRDVTRRTGPFVHEAPHAGQRRCLPLPEHWEKEHRPGYQEPNRGFYIAAPGPGVRHLSRGVSCWLSGPTGAGLAMPAALERLNPGLIYTSVTPFGQTGPYRDYKGSELIAQAMGALIRTSLACPTRSRCGSVGMPLAIAPV